MCLKPIAIISFWVAVISNLLNSLNVVNIPFDPVWVNSVFRIVRDTYPVYFQLITDWLMWDMCDMCDEWDASFNSSAYFTSQFVVKHVLYAKQG